MSEDLKLGLEFDDSKARRSIKGFTDYSKQSFLGIEQAFSKINLAAGVALGNLASKAVTAGINALSNAFNEAQQSAKEFSKNIAEINSILPANEKLAQSTTQTFIEFSKVFNTSAGEQAKAFYEIVSAGITGLDNQLAVLEQSNKAAVAGLTSTAVAADILTTSLNVYGKQGLTAKEASDQLFVAVREGKTRFDELASTVGRVAPIAQSAGVRFDEMAGTLAFLTKNGIGTDEAVTGLRAILVDVIKPSTQAAEAAKQMGIDFSTAAIRSKGLAAFLKEISQKTGGDENQIAKLFTDVRALSPVLTAVRGDFDDFVRVLGAVKNETGSTDLAFQEITKSFDYQSKLFSSQISAISLSIYNLFVPAMTEALISKNNFLAEFNLGNFISSIVDVGLVINEWLVGPLEFVFDLIVKSGLPVLQALGTIFETTFNKIKEVIGSTIAYLSEKFSYFFPKLSQDSDSAFTAVKDHFTNNFKEISDQSLKNKADDFLIRLRDRAKEAQTEIDGVKARMAEGFTPEAQPATAPAEGGGAGGTALQEQIAGYNALDEVMKKLTESTFPTTQAAFDTFKQNTIKFAAQIKAALMGGIANGAGQAFAAFGRAVVKGEDPLKAFAKTMLATIGTTMIQLGTAFILEGIALTWAGFGNGPGLIAAGAALAAFGGVMSAVFADSGGASAGGGVGGGTLQNNLFASDIVGTEAQPAQQEAKTQVNVTVEGNVFDSAESGMKIVDAIRDSIEKDGVVLVRNG